MRLFLATHFYYICSIFSFPQGIYFHPVKNNDSYLEIHHAFCSFSLSCKKAMSIKTYFLNSKLKMYENSYYASCHGYTLPF
jgi:hypothetical protein